MIDISKRLTDKQRDFFDGLSLHIDKPLYFYGSVNRSDYIKGKSDIDVDIFTDNENSTIHKLCDYLKLKKNDFKKCVLKTKNKVIYGYKVEYENEKDGIQTEMSIYNDSYKEYVLRDHSIGNNLPFYVVFALYIIKYIYYNLGILPKKIYKQIKKILMNENGEDKFILFNNS